METSVIICAHRLDRRDLLAQAVASVRKQTLPAHEIIVVIDRNEQLARRAKAELEGVIVVSNSHAPGLSGGRQSGADLATSPILAFLDDDAVADPQWLAELSAAYEDQNVLGAGGPVTPLWLDARPRWLPGEFNWVLGCTYDGMQVDDGRIRGPIGANMSMRADVLRRAGSFDARLSRVDRGGRPAGTAEETEFCLRAARLHPGGYWLYLPRARVRHVVPAERTTWRYFVRRCRMEGIAKAELTLLTGSRLGLASERRYVRFVLPRAALRELRSAGRGRPEALMRAAAIGIGVGTTTLSYAAHRGRLWWRSIHRSSP